MVPFFYIPVLSRMIGHPVYNWIAANRSRLSVGNIWNSIPRVRAKF
jgi:hypothetical protein